ncbi:MAG: TonB-dependent receptor [Phenylobacterium zucineum]|nr:MAG: TonB-dependent receptor [Phenylobacterium zucineum]
MPFRTHASVLALSLALTPAVALAQAQQSSLVDELVVTAQKREQSLQDVPIVVTTLSQQILEDAGVRDVKDLMQVTPGLVVSSTFSESATVARIRGVGTVGDNPGLEASVGIVIDGVYRPRAGTGIGDLGELQRIEVLKGPQGTLFGKNTSAGVINVLTQAPEFEFGGDAELTLGNFDAREAAVSVTGPLVADRLAGRLYVAGRKRDGFTEVVTAPGRDDARDMNRNYWTARGQLLFTPSEDLSVRGIVDFTQRNENCCLALTQFAGAATTALNLASGRQATLSPADPGERLAYANRGSNNDVRDKGVSAEVNWDTPWLGGASLTSITAWRNWRSKAAVDADFTGADLLWRGEDDFRTEFKFFSQEFRLAGEAGRLNWMVGYFYNDEDLEQLSTIRFGNDLQRFLSLRFSGNASNSFLSTLTGLPVDQILAPGGGTRDLYRQGSKTSAIFTNNSFRITEALELTVGLRFTQESKTLAANYSNFGSGGVSCQAVLPRTSSAAVLAALCAPFNDFAFRGYNSTQKAKDDEVTGTAKLSYRFSPDLMTYVSYARGYKSGGFNLDRSRFAVGVPDPNTFFPAEKVDSYEIGVKSTLADGNLLLNGAFFYQDFSAFQLNTYTGISYLVSSIPEVISRGVDADFLWRTPVDGLQLQGGVTFSETEFGHFTPGPGVSLNLPGGRLSGAPRWSGSVSATYDRPLTDKLDLHANVSARYTSDYNTGSDLNPLKVQKAFTLVNARVGVGPNDEAWRVEAWVANLFKEDFTQVIFDPSLQTGSLGTILGPPRTYGLTLRVDF